MVRLEEYTPKYSFEVTVGIADFFNFHAGLVDGASALTEEELREAEETLAQWQSGDSALYVILSDGGYAGFLRTNRRGPIVIWIEDIYVLPGLRGRGIATEAIRLVEKRVASDPTCRAVCIDVVPRNEKALALYHRLGFTDISVITLRKELGQSKRDRPVRLLGHDFNV